MGFLGTNPQDQYKNVVQTQDVSLDPETYKKQQAFTQALQTQAAGQGPSVAGQLLQNAQSQNAANANSLIAGSRGTNAGMAQRQALNSNANANQNAAGQAAAMKAQEQLNGQQQLGGQLNAMQSQYAGVQNMSQQNRLGAAGINAGLAQGAAKANGDIFGSALNAVGTAGTALLAEGGAVGSAPAVTGPTSFAGKFLKGMSTGTSAPGASLGTAIGKGIKDLFTTATPSASDHPDDQMWANYTGAPSAQVAEDPSPVAVDPASSMGGAGFAKGGRVPAKVSPGERYLPPAEVKKVAEGKKPPMQAGEKIPGKPKVGGAKDSYANDTVDKSLESGGIIIPRHITMAKDAPEKAAAFVRAIIAKQGLK